MVLSKETLRRRYNNGGTGGKRGRPAKKEHPKAKEKRLRLEAAANRAVQTSKLRSSSANDVTCDVDVDVEPAAPASACKSSASARKASRAGTSARKPSARAATRTTSRVLEPREAKVDRYVAAPATPSRDGNNPWHSTKRNHQLKIDILNKESKKLTASNYHYKRLSKMQEREITALNKKLLACDIPDDRPPHPDDLPWMQVEMDAKDIQKFVGKVMNGYTASDKEIVAMFVSLGLDKDGRLTNKEKKEKMATGVRMLLDLHFGRYSEKEQADILGELAVNSKLFGTEAANSMSATIAASVNASMFSAVRLLHLIDSSAGSTNDSCCTEIARIPNSVDPTLTKRGKGLFTHRNQITQARNIANRSVNEIFQIDHQQHSKWGDRAVTGYENSFRFMLDAFGLTDAAVAEGVEWAWTCDGARLTTKDNQTLTGLKAIDKRCCNPSNPSEKLCEWVKDGDERQRLSYHRYQSTDNCILTGAVSQGECKDVVHNCFGEMISFCKHVERHGLPASRNGPAIKPCPLVCTADMSLHQKVTNSGGACKVKAFFCHMCGCRSDPKSMFQHVEGDKRCNICIFNEREKCGHHWKVLDGDAIESVSRELHELILEDLDTHHLSRDAGNADPKRLRDFFPTVGPIPVLKRDEFGDPICFEGVLARDCFDAQNEPTRSWMFDYTKYIKHSEERIMLQSEESHKCRITLDQNAVDKESKTNNIEYAYRSPEASRQDKNTFHANVIHDLNLRFREIPEGRDARVALLRKRLELGERVRELRGILEEYERVLPGRLFCPGQCPPDVLHFHCRAVEKIIQQLLLCGMRNNLGKQLAPFVQRVQDVVNRDILKRKNVQDPGWYFPLSPDKKKLGDVNLSNNMAKKLAKGFSHLVDVCTEDCEPHQQSAWHTACQKFPAMAAKLESKQEFEFVDVAEFQLLADEFCDAYFSVTGRDGMTNYLHLLKAGHFSWFLNKYGNLYRLSQQGWENVNGRFKRKYFQNSQRGGGKGKGSKLAPVFYTFMREHLWRVGYLDGFFNEIMNHDGTFKVQYGKIKRVPKSKRVLDEDIELYAKTIFHFAGIDALETIEEGSPDDIVEEGSA